MFAEDKAANDHAKPDGKEAAAGAKETGGDLPEWVYIENKISTLDSQVKSKKASIEKLVEEKNNLKSTDPKVKEIIKQIVSIHKEVSKDIEEYEKQKALLRYRYPEKGAAAKRKYQQIELKSVDEIEQDQTVDGRLSKAVKKMRQQYGNDESVEEQKKKIKKEKISEAESVIIIQK